MGYYFIRAMSQSADEFSIFFGKNVAAVGWSDVNFSAYQDLEDLATAVDDVYYVNKDIDPRVRGKKLNEVRRFKSLKSGDRIIIPYYEAVCLGTIEDGEHYDSNAGAVLDLANQRNVSYLQIDGKPASVPRTKLGEGLQRRLRVRGTTIADLREFADELEGLLKDPSLDWLSRVTDKDKNRVAKWKALLLLNVQSGKTYLKAGGRGLEELVQYLLELEGYKCSILSKRYFSGLADADVKATRVDRVFGETNLFVQVKHHAGESDTWGATQLSKILTTQPELRDHTLVLITTAAASKELQDYCQNHAIRLLTGQDLIDWVMDHLPRLSSDWRNILGIGKTGEILF